VSRRLLVAAFLTCALSLPLGVRGDDQTPSEPPPSPPAETPVPLPGDAALAVLAERYYQVEWKFHPTDATETGVHTYDALLDPVMPDAIQAEIAHLHAARRQLQQIDPAKLSLDGQADQHLLDSNVETGLFRLEERPAWRRNPSYYSDIAAGGAYAIMSRDFAPLDRRLALVIAREKQIPALLAQGEKNLEPSIIAPITANIGLLDAQGSVDFFAHDVPAAFAGVKDSALRAQFAASNAAAIAAFKSYAAFIQSTVVPQAHGSYAIGAANYAKLERLQNVEDIPLSKLLSIGQADLAKNRAAFIATARAIDPHKTPQEVIVLVQHDHSAPDLLLATAQGDLNTAVALIKAKSVIDLPPAPLATAVKTPSFEAQTSFASMDSPGPLETKATEAYYNVTLPDRHWSAAQVEEHMRANNRAFLLIVSTHEAYPGHYTNYLFNKQSDLSLIRKLEWNNAFGEGWAHYDEQMMVDEGLGNGDPKVRLVQLQQALWRDARLIIGIKEHTQGMSVDEATTFFMANVFVPRTPAYREAIRGTGDPLYGYYTLGKLSILKLRADYQAKMGASYSLRAFHDALLAHGDPPLYYARRFLLGPGDTGSLL
jgi:uncharacterized protein (DUF885 family)